MSESGAGRNVALMGKPAKERRVAGDSYGCGQTNKEKYREEKRVSILLNRIF